MEKEMSKKKTRVNGPDHCIHGDEDPNVFIQIKLRLGENDAIYYDEGECTKKILWLTTVPDTSVYSSMLHSSYGGDQLLQATLCVC
jgi:hypothetical protein